MMLIITLAPTPQAPSENNCSDNNLQKLCNVQRVAQKCSSIPALEDVMTGEWLGHLHSEFVVQ